MLARGLRSVFVRHFIDALTVGGSNGNPKPIERQNLKLLLIDCDKNDLNEQTHAALTHIESELF